MPPKKEKLPDGSTRVSFTTKDGKHVVINRKPKEKRTRTSKPAASQAAQPEEGQTSESGGEAGEGKNDRPTNLLPVLVLDGYCSDDGEQPKKDDAVAKQQKPKRP